MTKMKQKVYTLSQSRAKKPLELVHIDICGPLNSTRGYDGNVYFVVFVLVF